MTFGSFVFGLALMGGLGWIAMREGSEEAELMADCVQGKLHSLNQYVTDKELAYRIAVYGCRKYNEDGIVKIPVGKR
jgi:hypothetical protein